MTDEMFNRRAADRVPPHSKIKDDIIEQLSEVDDPAYRVMLTLMLKAMDETNVYFSTLQSHMIQIHNELVGLRRTDDQIKSIVLNGHTNQHDDHHEWIDKTIDHLADIAPAIELAVERQKYGGYCDYAHRMLEAEKEAEELRKQAQAAETSAQAGVKWALVEKAILVVGGALLASILPYLGKVLGGGA